jgi:hypothetical protein
MKKLSLELLKLTLDEVLERSQMKKITGGYGSNPYYCACFLGGSQTNGMVGYYNNQSHAVSMMLLRCSGNGYCVPL